MAGFHFGGNMQPQPADAKRPGALEILNDLLFYIVGSAIYAASVSLFTAPNRIAMGGVTGISTLLHYLIHTPVGTMIFILNIPLFLLALRFIGGSFILKTIFCTFLVSVMTDLFGAYLPHYHGNMMLAALYGGLLSGIGLALVFLRGSTTGGTDVASRLLKLKYRHIPMGRMMMLIDAVIISLSALVFWSVDSALYALITNFASSRMIDSILYGAENGRLALVISDRSEEIARAVITDINRGATMLRGRGVYTGREREVLMCAVRRSQAAQLLALVRRIDPAAFVIMCNTGGVIGEGFKPITKED